MGRTGVTLFEIEEAASQLQGRGKTPSVDNIREVLGTGSKSTIAQHLKIWRSKNAMANGKLPTELLALVTGLWERLNNEADQQIQTIEITYQNKIQQLQKILSQSQQAFTEIQQNCHQLEENFYSERKTKEEYMQLLQDEKQACIKWQERCQENTKSIALQEAENVRLYQLAANVQANFEHYQTAVEKARTEQILQTEKKDQYYQQNLAVLQNELFTCREMLHQLDKDIEKKNRDHLRLIEEHQILQNNYKAQQQKFEENFKELDLLQERYTSSQREIIHMRYEIEQKNQILLQSEKERTVLFENSQSLQDKINHAEDKIETLRQEKLFLLQEKSELQGYIKHLDKMAIII